MARVTVEDCVFKVPNRFELVLLAAQRARDIAAGGRRRSTATTTRTRSWRCARSPTETVLLDGLQNSLIKGMQKHVEIDEPEEDHEIEDRHADGVAGRYRRRDGNRGDEVDEDDCDRGRAGARRSCTRTCCSFSTSDDAEPVDDKRAGPRRGWT